MAKIISFLNRHRVGRGVPGRPGPGGVDQTDGPGNTDTLTASKKDLLPCKVQLLDGSYMNVELPVSRGLADFFSLSSEATIACLYAFMCLYVCLWLFVCVSVYFDVCMCLCMCVCIVL